MSNSGVSLVQGLATIVLCGGFGGIGHGLVTGMLRAENPKQVALNNLLLGILAALIAFGVSGVSTAAIWQQMSTCAIAGVGGGQLVRSYLRTVELRTARDSTRSAVDFTKEIMDPPVAAITKEEGTPL